MNDILQVIAVAIVLAMAVIWVIRRARRKPSDGCGCACDDCPARTPNCELLKRRGPKGRS